MAWMQSEKDRERLNGLARLEDKRVAFAARLEAEGLRFTDALLVQQDGGFQGIGLADGRAYLLSGPAPADDAGQFECVPLDNPSIEFEPFVIPSDGMGGMLGMGKKGGAGYKLYVRWSGGEREMEFVPALMCVLDVAEGERLPLTDTQRAKRDYNFVWDFKVIDRAQMDRIALRWLEMMG